MYEFRDEFCREIGAELIIEKNEEWIARWPPGKLWRCTFQVVIHKIKIFESHLVVGE